LPRNWPVPIQVSFAVIGFVVPCSVRLPLRSKTFSSPVGAMPVLSNVATGILPCVEEIRRLQVVVPLAVPGVHALDRQLRS
jgi:hypothetical protein